MKFLRKINVNHDLVILGYVIPNFNNKIFLNDLNTMLIENITELTLLNGIKVENIYSLNYWFKLEFTDLEGRGSSISEYIKFDGVVNAYKLMLDLHNPYWNRILIRIDRPVIITIHITTHINCWNFIINFNNIINDSTY